MLSLNGRLNYHECHHLLQSHFFRVEIGVESSHLGIEDPQLTFRSP